MWRFESGLLCCLCVALLLSPCTRADGHIGEDCDLIDLGNTSCNGTYQTCIQQNDSNIGKCGCIQGYQQFNGQCKSLTEINPPKSSTSTLKPDLYSASSNGGSSTAAILLVPTCLIVFGALAYFGGRRYKLVQRFRQFRQNRYGSVLVTRDDTDDDDPPLA